MIESTWSLTGDLLFARYILVDGTPVYEPDEAKWREWQRNIDNIRVALDYTWHGVEVSTVFLARDHNYRPGEGPAIFFETMVFGGELDQAQRRYSTIEEAQEGHALMLLLASHAHGRVRRKRLNKKLWLKHGKRQAEELRQRIGAIE